MDYDIGEIHDRHSGAKMYNRRAAHKATNCKLLAVVLYSMFRTLMKYQRASFAQRPLCNLHCINS